MLTKSEIYTETKSKIDPNTLEFGDKIDYNLDRAWELLDNLSDEDIEHTAQALFGNLEDTRSAGRKLYSEVKVKYGIDNSYESVVIFDKEDLSYVFDSYSIAKEICLKANRDLRVNRWHKIDRNHMCYAKRKTMHFSVYGCARAVLMENEIPYELEVIAAYAFACRKIDKLREC